MNINRRLRPEVRLGIEDESVFAGDHIAYFYETGDEFERAFGFLDVGLQGNDHCVIFGIEEDTDRALEVVEKRGWDTAALLASRRLSVIRPAPTCDETVTAVSAHFQGVLDAGAHDHAGGVRGSPVTLHRNCIRENPLYVPRSKAAAP